MKKIVIIFCFLLMMSVSAFAQTINWTSIHPRALTQGTNTYSGGFNSGEITVAQSAQSCSSQAEPQGPCDSGDTSYSFADWHTDYSYNIVFYDVNGNMIPVTLTITNLPYIDCGPGHPEAIGYQKYSWTTAPGSPAIAYVQEIVDINHLTIYSAGNTECYYNQSYTPGDPGYPLGSPFSGVLLGPLNNPLAIGPTSNNDDYTNKSLIGNIVGTTTTTSQIISFQNTVRNKDTISDSAVITAPTVPSGFIVEASPNCSAYTTISSGGSITVSGIPGSSNATFCVRITAPSGIATFTPFSTLLRATSVNDPIKTNDTIDRIYTGFITSTKTASIVNSTGIGGPTDAVPGAQRRHLCRRHRARRSARRPAGHAVRLGRRGGHDPLHHQPAEDQHHGRQRQGRLRHHRPRRPSRPHQPRPICRSASAVIPNRSSLAKR